MKCQNCPVWEYLIQTTKIAAKHKLYNDKLVFNDLCCLNFIICASPRCSGSHQNWASNHRPCSAAAVRKSYLFWRKLKLFSALPIKLTIVRNHQVLSELDPCFPCFKTCCIPYQFDDLIGHIGCVIKLLVIKYLLWTPKESHQKLSREKPRLVCLTLLLLCV